MLTLPASAHPRRSFLALLVVTTGGAASATGCFGANALPGASPQRRVGALNQHDSRCESKSENNRALRKYPRGANNYPATCGRRSQLLSPGAPRGHKNGNFRNGHWTADAIEERRWLRSLVQMFATTG